MTENAFSASSVAKDRCPLELFMNDTFPMNNLYTLALDGDSAGTVGTLIISNKEDVRTRKHSEKWDKLAKKIFL